MMPGPITASTATSRAQRERNTFTPPTGVARTSASAMQDPREHVVHRDYAEQLSLLLHRQREEVVLGGQLRHLAGRVLGVERRRMLVHDRVNRHLRRGQQ